MRYMLDEGRVLDKDEWMGMQCVRGEEGPGKDVTRRFMHVNERGY